MPKKTLTTFRAECPVLNNQTREEIVDKMKNTQQKTDNPLYAWLIIWVHTHTRRYQGSDQVLGWNGVKISMHKSINSCTVAKTKPEAIQKLKLLPSNINAHLDTPDQELSIEQTPAIYHRIDNLVTSCKPRITNYGGANHAYRFWYTPNQGNRTNTTITPNRKETIRICSDPHTRERNKWHPKIKAKQEGKTNISQLADATVKKSRDHAHQKDKPKKNQDLPPHESEARDTQRISEMRTRHVRQK